MLIVHDLNNFKAKWGSATLTLGVFDGMHLGHQALIRELQRSREENGTARVLVTYHPHPDIVLGKKKHLQHPVEIYTYEEKLALLQEFELDAAVFLPFTVQLSNMPASRYLQEILLKKLRAKHIIIGYDQCFGRGRKGNYEFLKKRETRLEYRVDKIDVVRDGQGRIISSSIIRTLIQTGKLEEANRMLGRDFFITGTVVRGRGVGGKLQFPTANLEPPENKLIPSDGVYAGVAEWGGRRLNAMINIGKNPTFHQDTLSVEAHLLNFTGNLYGEQIRIHFKQRMRDEIEFASSEELISQLKKDKIEASRILSENILD